MCMCVSHGNMISIFDMTKPESGWKNTIVCSDNIRYMFIKKRSKLARMQAIQKIKDKRE